MKRENLYIVGGALLASTALTTVASAGQFTLLNNVANGGIISTTAVSLSAQVFGTSPSTTTVIGPNALAYRFNQPVSSVFTSVITVTGAKFATSGTSSSTIDVRAIHGTIGNSNGLLTLAAAATLGCTVAVATDKIILSSCTPTASQVSITGITISAVSFINATGLATAGASISLANEITVSSVAFETTAAQAVVTSKNSVTATTTATTGVSNIDVSASPSFAKFANGGTSVTIATINITQTGTLAANLSSAITGATAVGATNSITITSTALSDDATNGIRLLAGTAANSLSTTVTQFSSGTVTFTIVAANLQDSYQVQLSFNGTSIIDTAAAGTTAVAFSAPTPVAGTNAAAPPSATGTTAALSRNGLTIDINGIQPSVAQGARTYTSLLRIANTGSTAGAVTVVLLNEASGATLGTYTSASIPAGASLQLTSATIEATAGVTPTASVLYRATVTGNINGYVQHVNWNQDAGFFSDLSGRRTSVGGNN